MRKIILAAASVAVFVAVAVVPASALAETELSVGEELEVSVAGELWGVAGMGWYYCNELEMRGEVLERGRELESPNGLIGINSFELSENCQTSSQQMTLDMEAQNLPWIVEFHDDETITFVGESPKLTVHTFSDQGNKISTCGFDNQSYSWQFALNEPIYSSPFESEFEVQEAGGYCAFSEDMSLNADFSLTQVEGGEPLAVVP